MRFSSKNEFLARVRFPGEGGRLVVIGLMMAGMAGAAIEPPANAREHWAFQPLLRGAPPEVRREGWVKSDIDRFILARLEAVGLAPAAPADARALIRRMSFGLTGLPPKVEEVDAFVVAAATDGQAAVGELIDRLLASPRYGERWGRHWLDVARYSDTKGYVYGREERQFVHAPAYRDWVIRAFNEDLAYDRFLLLQLAGDQLVAPDSPDLAAMGFLTGGRRFIGVTHDIIDDRIDVVTRGTMGLTVACARCHDHKYDPVPTADYYSLYGVFHGGNDRLVPLAASDDGELAKRRGTLESLMTKRLEEAGERLRSRIGDYLAAQLELKNYPEEGFDQILSPDDLIPASVRRWRDYLQLAKDRPHPIFGPWLALAAAGDERWSTGAAEALARAREQPGLNSMVAAAFVTMPASMREAAERYGRVFQDAEGAGEAPGAAELRAFCRDADSPTVVPATDIVNNDMFFPTSATEELWKLQGEVDRRLIELGVPAALILADRKPGPNPRVFNRGLASALGPEVPRRWLEVLSTSERQPFRRGSGRLELAQAIASPDNPLTARVLVNRVWQHHFGTGLVKTSSDFGLRAEAPSHPELLDWLARRFVDGGWKLKDLHRLILSSAVYQLSARHDGIDPAVDPDNRLLARWTVRRLDFESLRDSMLWAAGELDLAMGGRGQPLLDEGNHRRTVYAFVDRQFLPGTFRTFDFANPDLHVAARHETTVPQQALYFLNGAFAAHRARALAKATEGIDARERVERLHRLVYQRAATEPEVEAAVRFVAMGEGDAATSIAAPPESPWRYGTGAYDEAGQRVDSFTPLPHGTGTAWQGAAAWPGGETGWAQLTADGGHPGNTRAQACIRRWVAATAGPVTVAGRITHEPTQGDGVRAFVVSSRHGLLAQATVHAGVAELRADGVVIEPGDTIDFLVDIDQMLNSDQFLWQPTVTAADRAWNAAADFSAPPPPPVYLTPWEQYAQVLLLSNETAFIN
ncbi:MAG: DUF1549 and DUF1553 domain-containing protein [Verrucomicrobiales bacterium]